MVDIRVVAISPGPNARIDTRRLQIQVRDLMRDTVANGNRFIARYPAQKLRKTRYRRTNTLKRSWSFRVRQGGRDITGEVGSNSNIAPYNKYVQGRRPVRIFRQAGCYHQTSKTYHLRHVVNGLALGTVGSTIVAMMAAQLVIESRARLQLQMPQLRE